MNLVTLKSGTEKIDGLVKIKAEFAYLYTQEQNNFTYEAIRKAGGSFAIFPYTTIKTGKNVTFAQQARHCTVADLEYLELA